MSLESVLTTIDNEGLEFIRFEFGDVFGISRSRIVPARHFKEKASSGIAITLSQMLLVINGSETLIHTPYRNGVIGLSDVTWRPDMNTFQVLPWYSKTATIFLEPTDDGDPVSFYPRFIARKQIERLDQLGLSLLAAHEHEFYVVGRESGNPLTPDTMPRATVGNYADPDFLYQLMRDLYKVGIDVEMAETEQGPGQVEITYKPTFGIQAADNAHLFKTSVKEIAQKHGYIASFMSKPYKDQMGSSAHLNHSLWDKEGKRNLFDDIENPTRVNEVGQHWMAGILNHSRALSMIMAPTVNCYKCGAQSCVNSEPSWGFDNRGCMLRVKTSTTGTYIEYRSPGAGSNPYLTLVATIAAGIDGIERKLQLPAEETECGLWNGIHNEGSPNAPNNLQEAMDEFKADDVMKNAFGIDFCEAFFALKAYEIKLGQTNVDASEEDKYVLERKMYFNYL